MRSAILRCGRPAKLFVRCARKNQGNRSRKGHVGLRDGLRIEFRPGCRWRNPAGGADISDLRERGLKSVSLPLGATTQPLAQGEISSKKSRIRPRTEGDGNGSEALPPHYSSTPTIGTIRTETMRLKFASPGRVAAPRWCRSTHRSCCGWALHPPQPRSDLGAVSR